MIVPWNFNRSFVRMCVAATSLSSLATCYCQEILGSIPYAYVHKVEKDDSEGVMIEKAAKVLPRPNQSAWMQLERTFFLHFGMNTFRAVEWGNGREHPAIFNPTELDATQWIKAIKDAGGTMIILVSKHHEGFCMWPTRYTAHSVVAAPWREGKGDVVRAVTDAAKAEGIKVGIYLSPADLYQLRTNPQNPGGYYGNGSAKRSSTIPTDPSAFHTTPTLGRPSAPGFGSFNYEVDDYNRYFLNQLYELLTEYGAIENVWFDGANPDPSVPQTYDYASWYDLIRSLQPQATISVKAPDVRWVGNEGGYGRTTEWSVIPLSAPPETHTWPDLVSKDLGSRAKLTPESWLWWYPAEVNTSILNGWFWAPTSRTKSPAELVDYFYRSVGRNGNMLLNLAPDPRGLIPEPQLSSLKAMAEVLRNTFAHNLSSSGHASADSTAEAHGANLALDGNRQTWWEAAPGMSSAILTLELDRERTFDVVSLQEAVDHRSQRIESFVVEVERGGEWEAPKALEEQTTVGHKRLVRLAAPATTKRIRIRITGARLEPTLSEIGIYKQSLPLQPDISDRGPDGIVTLTHPHALPILYTLDGHAPTANSPVYKEPLLLENGGTLMAAVLTAENQIGLTAGRTFVGAAPLGWTASGGPARQAAKAIDADPKTLWEVSIEPSDQANASGLTVDLGSHRTIEGFAYLPRQDWNFNGVVDRYRFETSMDGAQWVTQIAAGEFGNIKNNPMLQQVTFEAVEARYIRFIPLRDVTGSGSAHVAEITVLPVLRK